MKQISFIISILMLGITFGQDYAWPTSTGKQLTSNFGEFRGDHFHMGLDIRTNQSVNHPLYAVDDGYVFRISTNFKGYGKALYLKTKDGNIALYGHLLNYSKELEEKLREIQIENESYIIDHYFASDEFPVKRGNIMAFSGNSGGSMGPHLHFEIRNKLGQPLEPFSHGFAVPDELNPVFLNLAILPVNKNSLINGYVLPKTFNPIKTGVDSFAVIDTVAVSGPAVFAIRVEDKISGSAFSYQIKTFTKINT